MQVHVFASEHQAGLAREQGTMKQVRGSATRAWVYQEGRGPVLVLQGSMNVLLSFYLYQLKRRKRTWLAVLYVSPVCWCTLSVAVYVTSHVSVLAPGTRAQLCYRLNLQTGE